MSEPCNSTGSLHISTHAALLISKWICGVMVILYIILPIILLILPSTRDRVVLGWFKIAYILETLLGLMCLLCLMSQKPAIMHIVRILAVWLLAICVCFTVHMFDGTYFGFENLHVIKSYVHNICDLKYIVPIIIEVGFWILFILLAVSITIVLKKPNHDSRKIDLTYLIYLISIIITCIALFLTYLSHTLSAYDIAWGIMKVARYSLLCAVILSSTANLVFRKHFFSTTAITIAIILFLLFPGSAQNPIIWIVPFSMAMLSIKYSSSLCLKLMSIITTLAFFMIARYANSIIPIVYFY